MRKFCLLLLVMMVPLVCHASGYALYEMNAAAVGMADAYICRVDNPSAVWYNPAALTRLEGDQLSISTTIQNLSIDFVPRVNEQETIRTGTLRSFPSNLFYSHQFTEDAFFGVGIYQPFALNTEWPEDSISSFISRKFDLRTYYVTPSVGFKLTPNLSIGGGMDFVIADLEIDRFQSLQPAAPAVIEQQVKVDGNDLSINLGVLVETSNNWQFALTYKNRVDVNFDGSAVFLNVPALFRDDFPDGGANITLPFPSQLMFGAATRYDKFSFEGDIIYVRWRDFEALRLNFDRNIPEDQNIRRGYESTWSLRFGADYRINQKYIVRAGVFHDPTPVPEKAVDQILPDASRNGITAGFGYDSGRWSFSVGYQALFYSDRFSPLDNFFSSPLASGLYSNHAHFLSFGFAYKFAKS